MQLIGLGTLGAAVLDNRVPVLIYDISNPKEPKLIGRLESNFK